MLPSMFCTILSEFLLSRTDVFLPSLYLASTSLEDEEQADFYSSSASCLLTVWRVSQLRPLILTQGCNYLERKELFYA